ncbi:sigma-70 family RNA polymerase sigma factor [Planosporangium sp. 12N6]|uniref:sigma-70 family RNA polymerase sigma factor n=1 Tax=Planosporangium spinosum TaxID=3402278 RepID=UPI003CF450AD
MDDGDGLARRFEAHRERLRAVAYRMLGSLSEADDAVQEAWLRLSRTGTDGVENLGGWLTTVVARVCLDMLRTRRSRREEPLEAGASDPVPDGAGGIDPEREALLADSVGLALLVVLDRLTPAERLAFVLHDLFDVPFGEIAHIVERSPAAVRQLASRARRRVRAVDHPAGDPARQREIVTAFLAASRDGDLDALVALLDPDVMVRADAAAAPTATPVEVHGAAAVARQALTFARGARYARPALVDGAAGIVVAPQGRLSTVLTFTIRVGKIIGIEVVADHDRLRRLDVAVLDE